MLWQPPARKTIHLARADSDEPDASRADAQAVGRRSSIGAEYEAEQAQTKDGAGGGPAEEQTCARGRCMRLLKIGESLTQMRGRDDVFRMGPLKLDFEYPCETEPMSREPSARLVVSAVNRYTQFEVLDQRFCTHFTRKGDHSRQQQTTISAHIVE